MAIDRYTQMTGYNAATGVPDNGTPTAADMLSWVAAPILDLDGKPWPCAWASVDHTAEAEIHQALARFPLRLTVGLPASIAQYPEKWADPPLSGMTPDEGHGIVLGFDDSDGWWVRTWGLDYPVHPDLMKLMLLAVDVPIPHPASAPPEFQMAGADYDSYKILA